MIKRKYMKLLFVLYLLVLLKVIVFKYPLGILREIAGTWSKEVLWEGLSGANFVLFRTIKMYIRHWNNRGLNSFGNLVGNVVAFIPLGYFLPRLWKPMRSVKRHGCSGRISGVSGSRKYFFEKFAVK